MAMQDLTASLDLKQNLNIYATCKQFDSLNLILNIFDNSVQADLSNYNVRLKALKADQVPLIQENTGITVSNNQVTIEAHEQLTTTAGKTPIELQFIDKTTGKKKATFNLVLVVVPSTVEVNGTISTATYTLLEELENKLDQAGDYLQNIDQAIEVNNELKSSITSGTTLDSALKSDITAGTILDSALKTDIQNTDTAKENLESATSTANTAKDNLHAENVQAEANKEALAALGDVTQLAQNVQANTNSIENINTSLSEKANQSSLETTNNNVSTHLSDLVTDTDGAHGLKIENGLFTPTIVDSANNQPTTYSIQKGYYQKIGNLVWFSLFVSITVKGTTILDTNNILISGLPFLNKNNDNAYAPVVIGYSDYVNSGTGKTVHGSIEPNSNKITLTMSQSDGMHEGYLLGSALMNATAFIVSGQYQV